MKMQKNLKRLSSIKILISTFIILLSFCCSWAQSKELEPNIRVPNASEDYKSLPVLTDIEAEALPAGKIENAQNTPAAAIKGEQKKTLSELVEIDFLTDVNEQAASETGIKDFSDEKTLSQIEVKEKFHWKPALIQSGIVLGIQHGFRLTQEKTTREFSGKFFHDWAQSVKNLRGWKDGDDSFTNYVAHPLQGGVTGRIFINNSDRAKKQEFEKSKEYWESRFKAMAWSAVWSTQFELGPISEATIGNVGLRQKDRHSTMAYVDLVVTPVVGTVVVIAEDAIDKYILKNWIEKEISNKVIIKLFRIIFTPTTSFSNLLRVKRLSWRDNRPL